jgi:DNA repair exonuclease SbcCD ATPase subunit
MNLERLSVKGFRSFANPYEFTPDPHFTVIHAPNGTGKSTLLDALYYGLLDRHTVSGREADARFRSLGRDLTPAIEVDFSVGNTRYRLTKTFLGSRSASLQRLENGRYQSLYDGSAADDFVRELFSAEPSGRGAIDSRKHLGFAHVLWSPGRAGFDDVPPQAGDAIRTMLGGAAAAVTEGERHVEGKVLEYYRSYFTGGGAYAKNATAINLPELDLRLGAARQAELDAREQFARLARLNERLEDREADASRMSAKRDELLASIAIAKTKARRYSDLATEAERANYREAATRHPYERLRAEIEAIVRLRDERAILHVRLGEARSELDAATAMANGLSERIVVHRQKVEDADAALALVQLRAPEVTSAETFVRDLGVAERLESRLSSYDVAAAEFEREKAELAAIVAPSTDELERLRADAVEWDRLQATIAAAALALEIDAEAEFTFDVVTGASVGPRSIEAGRSITIAAADDSVVVDIPGIGRIRARGTDGAAKARKELAGVSSRLEIAREKYGTAAVPELATRMTNANRLKERIASLEARLCELLDRASPEDLRREVAEVRVRLESIGSDRPAWYASMPDAPALRAAFDRDLRDSMEASKGADRALRAAEAPKRDIDAVIRGLQDRYARSEFALAGVTEQLSRLEADGHDDASREKREAELAMEWSAARTVRDFVARELASFETDPRERLARLEKSEAEVQDAYAEALDQASTCRGQIELQSNLGDYAKLVAAEERSALLAAELANETAKAQAIKCLRDAFVRVQAERVAAIVAPITKSSTRFFHRIAGTGYGSIEIGDGLVPRGLIDLITREPLSIDGTLSTGEKEQIYLATRLALAELIAETTGRRQLFVVDDALTATDPNRLRRFVAILEELAQDRLQVIVTTADKSRYLGIAGAKHIDLEAELFGRYAA